MLAVGLQGCGLVVDQLLQAGQPVAFQRFICDCVLRGGRGDCLCGAHGVAALPGRCCRGVIPTGRCAPPVRPGLDCQRIEPFGPDAFDVFVDGLQSCKQCLGAEGAQGLPAGQRLMGCGAHGSGPGGVCKTLQTGIIERVMGSSGPAFPFSGRVVRDTRGAEFSMDSGHCQRRQARPERVSLLRVSWTWPSPCRPRPCAALPGKTVAPCLRTGCLRAGVPETLCRKKTSSRMVPIRGMLHFADSGSIAVFNH